MAQEAATILSPVPYVLRSTSCAVSHFASQGSSHLVDQSGSLAQ